MNPLISSVFLLLLTINSFSQSSDSLLNIWKDETAKDSVRLDAIHNYAKQFMYSQPDSTLALAGEELSYSRERGLELWEGKALNLKGGAYLMKREFAAALEAFQLSYEIRRETNHLTGMSESLNNIGNIYYFQGNYTKALNYFVRSLKLEERAGNKQGYPDSYLNIATIYAELEEYDKALEYMHSALRMYRENQNKSGIASTYNNMGNVLKAKGDLDSALVLFQYCYRLLEALNDKVDAAICLSNIANLQLEKGKYKEAFEYYNRSLKLYRQTGNREGQANVYASLGELHSRLGQLDRSEYYCRQALEMARAVQVLPEEREAAECLYLVYKKLGHKEALYYYETYTRLQDSIDLQETSKHLARIEFEKQVLADSLKREEERLLMEAAHKEEMLKETNRKRAFLLGGLSMLILTGAMFGRVRYMRKAKEKIAGEKERSDQLLLNILPAEVAEELKQKGEAAAREFQDVTILFSDFKDFTALSEHLSARELVTELNACFRAFDEIVARHGIEKIKTVGDAYMAAGGLPVSDPQSAANTVKAALEMQAFIAGRKKELEGMHRAAFEMRVGIHSGTVVAGIVGFRKFQYDIWGDAVNTASRMETAGDTGKVNLSKATYELIEDDPAFSFESRGSIPVKGKGEMEMFFVYLKNPVSRQTS